MKKLLMFSISLLTFTTVSFAQYYYKDILSNQQLLADMASYKENKIHTVNIKSFENDGSPSESFFCQKKISKDYKTVELFTRSAISGPSEFITVFNSNAKLLSTTDSSNSAVTHNIYSYDSKNRISSISSSVRSNDDDFTNEILEEHIYSYNEQDQPVKMIRIKNNTDSTTILFANDENNNVSIEKDSKNGSKYYYYYDVKKRLTDIVQANDFKTKLLPDYLFEYNGNNQLTQMTSTEEGGNYYFIWKYTYDNGLRVKEKCYGKERSLLGSVEYEYR
ncbi:MAG: hypothetical protein ABJA37_10790 [Ferruginibacter sp.]